MYSLSDTGSADAFVCLNLIPSTLLWFVSLLALLLLLKVFC